ncbi:hypothetical protein GYMLUDRAFT_251717 [Collybiopsis luxurians FD-317 M1]|uniref:Uncharacterized protein n=1 Tax=Collybiopsis luxurians FD-317 M1 TaxID=944289 RepID=A0A0D0BBX1_9AGAR|nr:hypothetical protein GYMLUDRAFT_251717 [Collybiopsis luxurians FD-317 M1]
MAGSNSRQVCDVLVWQKAHTTSAKSQRNDELFVISFKKSWFWKIFYSMSILAAILGYTIAISYCSEPIRQIANSIFEETVFRAIIPPHPKPSIKETGTDHFNDILKTASPSQLQKPVHTGLSSKHVGAASLSQQCALIHKNGRDINSASVKDFVLVPDLRRLEV